MLTYATPELLLVGAAQNLVLGPCDCAFYDSEAGQHLSCVFDCLGYEPAPTW